MVPVMTCAYGLAGGWENAEKELDVGKAAGHVGYDAFWLVALHVLIIVPPLLMALFTLVSTAAVWVRAKQRVPSKSHHNMDEGPSGSTPVALYSPGQSGEPRSGV